MRLYWTILLVRDLSRTVSMNQGLSEMEEASSWSLRCKKIEKMPLSGILWILKITSTFNFEICTVCRPDEWRG